MFKILSSVKYKDMQRELELHRCLDAYREFNNIHYSIKNSLGIKEVKELLELNIHKAKYFERAIVYGDAEEIKAHIPAIMSDEEGKAIQQLHRFQQWFSYRIEQLETLLDKIIKNHKRCE